MEFCNTIINIKEHLNDIDVNQNNFIKNKEQWNFIYLTINGK